RTDTPTDWSDSLVALPTFRIAESSIVLLTFWTTRRDRAGSSSVGRFGTAGSCISKIGWTVPPAERADSGVPLFTRSVAESSLFLLTFWTVPHFHSGEFLILGDGTPIETIEKSIPVLCDIAHVEHPGSTSPDQLEWLGTGPWAP